MTGVGVLSERKVNKVRDLGDGSRPTPQALGTRTTGGSSADDATPDARDKAAGQDTHRSLRIARVE